jgi:hypothetical protein
MNIETPVALRESFTHPDGGLPIQSGAIDTMAELVTSGHISPKTVETYGSEVAEAVRVRIGALAL